VDEDLAGLVRHTVDDLEPALRNAGIEISVDATGGLRSNVDPDKIRQVLVNLVENSRDALREADAPRRIQVELCRCNGRARISIADNGPGIDAEDLPHLFEPFFSRKDSGTGLGLAIGQRTIEAHGGRIVADSANGSGCRFEIDLPLTITPRENHETSHSGRR